MKKGFTLIELLVVIAILAILATVIVVIINPGELLKQARDTTRISDLAAINSAIALYLSDVTTPFLKNGAACTAGTHYGTVVPTVATSSPFTVAGNVLAATGVTTSVSGAGWVSVNFTSISSGSPLARLPMDPQNTQTYYYAYGCGTGTPNGDLSYEVNAKMESTKYSAGGGGDVVSNVKDGGDNATWYEIGNNLAQ